MYRFKLQAVLDHRQFIEDNLKRELADIRGRVNQAEQTLEDLQGKEMDTAKDLRTEEGNGITSEQMLVYHVYLNQLAENIKKQKKTILKIKKQETAKQGELLEAMKRRQILEKLKAQGIDRYHAELLKKEMNFIDEIAVNQFVRKIISNGGDGEG